MAKVSEYLLTQITHPHSFILYKRNSAKITEKTRLLLNKR